VISGYGSVLSDFVSSVESGAADDVAGHGADAVLEREIVGERDLHQIWKRKQLPTTPALRQMPASVHRCVRRWGGSTGGSAVNARKGASVTPPGRSRVVAQ